jgi:DUF4097 and DUF4098 domain-containing protein YvlB
MKIKNVTIVLLVLGMTFGMTVMLQAGSPDVVKKRFETQAGKQTAIIYAGVDDDVFIETHGKNEILFTFEKELKGSESKRNREYFEKIHPEIDFNNNTLEIKIKYPKRKFSLFGSLSGLRLRVTSRLIVPANTDVKVKVVDGNIKASDLNGNLKLKTVDGDLKIKNCTGPMKLNTVDGNIKGFDCKGTIDTHTVDGDVKVSGVFNGIFFKSIDGEGDFLLQEGSRLTADCTLRTVDGDITLKIPDNLGFKLDFKAGDGDIRFSGLDFKNVTLKKKHRFQGERGHAEYTIEVRSTDGDLRLKEL